MSMKVLYFFHAFYIHLILTYIYLFSCLKRYHHHHRFICS